MKEKKFVFVVCGERAHIDTLHFSLKALKHFSPNEIIIVTDSSRNEIPVEHNNIIDIHTPSIFNHNQASIYLKTGLHNILPSGNLYCYLDTDVVALSGEVNKIFEKKSGIITFAIDHSKMHQFSPYAINCGCLDRNKADWKMLDKMLKRFDKTIHITNPFLLKKQGELKKKFELIKRGKLNYLLFALKYFLPGKILRLDENTYYDKEKRIWFDTVGNIIMYEMSGESISQIEKNSDLKWNYFKRRWINSLGDDIHNLHCNHLCQNINSKFQIRIRNKHWQHWNGGVFLFDDSSKNFMDAWHDKTMKIFKDPLWKTRDQGTLIATAWEFGLQNAPVLSKEFNFIADPSNPQLMISEDRKHLTDDAFITQYVPAFIHLFHNFGKTGWEVWDWVEKKLSEVNRSVDVYWDNE